MSGGFFDRVYRLVCLIPPGKVATYGQIAALLGHPRAARTVGWALHSLSDEQARVVPWQRVIGAGGRITTSCETHSAQLQRQLLEEEGIEFDRRGDIDMARFQWPGPEWDELNALLRVET
ncbi:MAG: methylated-DNA--[protein]-cysteine S-methyltransferase [Chloroflexi bacterium]|nr:methylated-DNA--[protein]-cysteine S-methyltransferase [Chloroflexota bacterium]